MMKYTKITIIRTFFSFVLPFIGTCSFAFAKQPNIILIVTDDQGYSDAGFRDSSVHTPNIDRIVAEGVELKRFYTASVCSPTRAGIMTGLYPIRFGMQRAVNRPFSEIGLPEDMKTLPEALGEIGYTQRHIVGKWHLGNMLKSQLPMNHGFTSQYGPYTSGIKYFDHTRFNVHDFHRNQETIDEEGYYSDLLSDEVVRIIEDDEGKDPFFVYLPYGAPHTPLEAPAKDIKRYSSMSKERATYLAMVTVVDQGIGRILDALDLKGISDNTLILFLSDNGGSKHGNNKPLKRGKGSLYEGGIRVVAAARWPAQIPAGTISEASSSYIDIMPTFLDAAGSPTESLAKKFDGESALVRWKGGISDDEYTFYSFYEKRDQEKLAIIQGDWKLIRQGTPILDGVRSGKANISLYNLSIDISESKNLAKQHPERVETMLKKLVEFRKIRPDGGVPPMIEPFPKGWSPLPNWEPMK